MDYSTQNICTLFNVSHQTVKNWATHFREFLSPTARPEPHKQRVYTIQDLAVFSLASQMLKAGNKYADVKRALSAGHRGAIPDADPDQLPAPVSGQVVALREALDTIRVEMRELQTALDETRGQNKLLREQLAERDSIIRQLYREIGQLEARADD